MPELVPLIVLASAGLFLLYEKALDFPSTVVTLSISYIIWTSRSFYWFLLLLAFFILAYTATKLHSIFRPSEAHEQRTTDNIISNGLVAFMSALFGFPYVYLGSISAALADTMSSEIGMLSKEKPFLITNPYKTVAPGTNGGMTWLGTFASVLGASIIASLVYYFLHQFFAGTGLSPAPAKLFLVVILAGVLGSLTDSVFGALFENNNKLSNGGVNFIATIAGGIFAYIAMAFL